MVVESNSHGSRYTVHYYVVAYNRHLIPTMIPHGYFPGTQELGWENWKGEAKLSYINNFQAILSNEIFLKKQTFQGWQFTPVILVLRKLRQVDCHDFHLSFGCIISLGHAGYRELHGLWASWLESEPVRLPCSTFPCIMSWIFLVRTTMVGRFVVQFCEHWVKGLWEADSQKNDLLVWDLSKWFVF